MTKTQRGGKTGKTKLPTWISVLERGRVKKKNTLKPLRGVSISEQLGTRCPSRRVPQVVSVMRGKDPAQSALKSSPEANQPLRFQLQDSAPLPSPTPPRPLQRTRKGHARRRRARPANQNPLAVGSCGRPLFFTGCTVTSARKLPPKVNNSRLQRLACRAKEADPAVIP